VLAGIQVPRAERAEFTQHLADLRYNHVDETANPVYRMFLST
jgi:threonine dehydratase